MEEDKPKSMWEATQKFILENYSGSERDFWISLFKAKFPGSFERKEESKKPVDIIPPPKPKVVLKPLVCKRCNRTWTPRKEELPIQCPKCRSPYWDRERVKRS